VLVFGINARGPRITVNVIVPNFLPGSDHPMSQPFQQISATGSCFPALAAHFPGQIRPVSFTRFPQRIRPTCMLDFAVHGLDTKLAFDLLYESTTGTEQSG